jgi:hypothetical protein
MEATEGMEAVTRVARMVRRVAARGGTKTKGHMAQRVIQEAMKSAVIDPSGTYRYSLGRQLGGNGPRIVWVMLNPSTADGFVDDPTIRKICGFSTRWGYSHVTVVNLFALRSTDPRALKRHQDPVGPENDAHIRAAVEQAATVVCAWGNHGALHDRDLVVRRLIRSAGKAAVVLGLNESGARKQPVHPLYQPYETQVSVWQEPLS